MGPPRGTACTATDKPDGPARREDRSATASSRRRARQGWRRRRGEAASAADSTTHKKFGGPMAPEPPCDRRCGCTVTTWRRLRAQPGARGVEIDHARGPRLARAPVDHLGMAIEDGERLVLAEEARGRGPEGEPDAGE